MSHAATEASGRPLVYLLRSPSDPDPYDTALSAAGYRARSVPVLRFTFVNREALREALGHPAAYGGLVLTSPRSAEALHRQRALDPDVVFPWTTKPAFVVGPRTAASARALGLRPEGADSGSADLLADRIADRRFERPLLFLCSDRRRDVLPDRLASAGLPVEELCVYETHLRTDVTFDPVPDWLVFFSPSGVEAVRQSGALAPGVPRIAAIGPTTAEALAAADLPPEAVAEAPTPEAVARAIREVDG